MKQFTLNLDQKLQRPVVVLDGILALLDTGAHFPIWTDDEDILVSLLNARLVKKGVEFGGFGGTARGNLYQMTFIVGKLIYPNMYIISCSALNVPFHMILSATMFSRLIYEIDDRHHKFNVTIPDGESTVRRLVIEDLNGKLHVLCSNTCYKDRQDTAMDE